MAYSFDMPIIRGLLDTRKKEEEEKVLQQLANNNTPPEEPEPIEGKQLVNQSIAPTIPQAMNPYQLEIQRGLTAQKQAYANARTNEERNNASSTAELLRAKGAAAGLDLSGYGADVTLNDAYKNLASQEARDIMGALQAYSMNSDQYYEDSYQQAIARGLSPRRAKQLAGTQARQYQANRVAYLTTVFGNYGVGEDGATNALGNQFLGMLAMENPPLANFYSNVYPNAKDTYKTATDIAREATKQGYALDLLKAGHEYDLKKMGEQFNYNQKAADADENRYKNRYWYTSNVDQQFFEKQRKFLQQIEKEKPGLVQEWFTTGYQVAILNGATEEQARIAGANYASQMAMNPINKGNSSGKSDSSNEPKMTAEQEALYNQSGNLLNNARNSLSDDDINAFEKFVNEHGTSFNPAYYQRWKDTLLVLKGCQCELRNDKAGAKAYFDQVRDESAFTELYPDKDWKEYLGRRGGKSK